MTLDPVAETQFFITQMNSLVEQLEGMAKICDNLATSAERYQAIATADIAGPLYGFDRLLQPGIFSRCAEEFRDESKRIKMELVALMSRIGVASA